MRTEKKRELNHELHELHEQEKERIEPRILRQAQNELRELHEQEKRKMSNNMKCNIQEEEHDNKIIYKELSYEIIAAALEVHRNLGPGFTENIYEEALCRELHSRGITFKRQFTVVIQYKGENVGRYQLDLLIDDKVVVELKAASQLLDHFEHQLHAYLKATGKKLGILLNFSKKSLEYRRIAR